MRDARTVAARVLVRVWQRGAFAAAALDAELLRHPELGEREARLCTELCYGVLRTGPELERRLDAYAPRQGWKRQPLVRAALLVAAYSLCFLDRVPSFAAVSAAVDAVARNADRRAAGFANAVLRRLAAELERAGRPALEAAALASVPAWLRDRIDASVGPEHTAALLRASGAPPLCLCLRRGEDREAWTQRLRSAAVRARVEPGALSPRCIVLRAAGDPRRLPGAGEAWTVQEQGAQLVALALGARPGESVLDACAGRGGKALLLAEEVGPQGAVDAADLYPAKLRRLREAAGRGGVRHCHAVDWTRAAGRVPDGYDRALVDAPCSGTGTLGRRPEIAGRLRPEDPARLAELQIAIVRAVASRVRDGGRLVYAVCSVLREEAEDVVEALQRPAPAALQLAPFDAEPVRTLAGDAPTLRLLPSEHGTDGYFLASFAVRRGATSCTTYSRTAGCSRSS
ncbi:MAG: Sun protein [Deltaproteobacteria bacterium]|nr:Sun protein [Deltaproteobacteria bacterium]